MSNDINRVILDIFDLYIHLYGSHRFPKIEIVYSGKDLDRTFTVGFDTHTDGHTVKDENINTAYHKLKDLLRSKVEEKISGQKDELNKSMAKSLEVLKRTE